MTNSISEIRNANCLFIIGSNTSENHPIIALEVMEAVRNGNAKLVVADPRKIRMVEFADIWLRQKPGTDVALINGLLHIIIKEELTDEGFISERTEGFEELKKMAEEYPPETVSGITGIPVDDLYKAARTYAEADTAAILYCMGITQHTTGNDNVLSLANLAMATGNVGKESTGVLPLRGQSNVQGACDMGALPNVYPGYQQVADEKIRQKFEKAWKLALSPAPGLTLVEMMNQIEAGNIKAMYVMGEDPVLSDPNSNHVRDALKHLDFLVTQDIFLNETGKFADVILPGTSFAEKDGTFVNTERRIQRVRKAIDPIGDSRPDWQIIPEIAARMGYSMAYGSPKEIMDEIASLTPAYGGVSYARLEGEGIQWPCPDPHLPGTKFLHKGKFSRGLGKFTAIPFKEARELPDEEYPFILSTGRILYHFHGGGMSRHSKGLDEIKPEAEVEINPVDAKKLKLSDGDIVELASRRGNVAAKVKITDKSAEGMAFMTFHYKEAAVNRLTIDALDPVAKIPEYKVCSVKIEPGVS